MSRRRLQTLDNDPKRVLEELVPALRRRQKLGIDTRDTDGAIDVSFAQIDGVEQLREASWDVSDFISTDRKGDVVCTENWGAIDPDVFFASHCVDLDVFGRIRAQRYERVHEVLHEISKAEGRLVRYSVVISLADMTKRGSQTIW